MHDGWFRLSENVTQQPRANQQKVNRAKTRGTAPGLRSQGGTRLVWLRSQKESVQWQETCEQGQAGPRGTKLRGQEEQTRQLQGRRARGSAWGGMSGVEGFW